VNLHCSTARNLFVDGKMSGIAGSVGRVLS
jgi:hypothetical protein